MPGIPQEFDPAILAALRHELARFDMLHAEWERLARTNAHSTSLKAVDLADRSLRHAYDTAAFHLSSACDHLLASRFLVSSGSVPTFAVMTMFRVAVETALAAYWTLEPDAPAERRSRGYAAAWADLDERRKVEAAAKAPPEAVARQVELLDDAERFGLVIAESTDEKGGISPRRLRCVAPGTVRLAQLYPKPDGCEVVYRYLCGYTHGKTWALRVGMQSDLLVELDHRMAVVPVATPDAHILGSAVQAVDAVALSIGRLSHLHEAVEGA